MSNIIRLTLVKPLRRACARGWKFGQNASRALLLNQYISARAAQNWDSRGASRPARARASEMQSCWLDKGYYSHRFTKVLKICPIVVDIVLIGISRHD